LQDLLNIYFLELIRKKVDETRLFTVDKWIMLIGGGIGMMTTSSMLILSIIFKEIRSSPGDLFIGANISEFMLSAHWFS